MGEQTDLSNYTNQELLENFAWQCVGNVKMTKLASFEELHEEILKRMSFFQSVSDQ